MRLDVHFEFGSPYTFLAWHRIQHHPAYQDVDLTWHPVSLYHIMQREGGKLNRELPNLLRTNRADIIRFAKAYRIPLRIAPSWPTNTLHALRGHFVAEDQGKAAEWRKAVFEAHWLHEQDIAAPDVLESMAQEAGIDGLLDRIKDDEVKARLAASTEEAYAHGVCGVPYFILHGSKGAEPFWGHDRMDWIEARLAGKETPSQWRLPQE